MLPFKPQTDISRLPRVPQLTATVRPPLRHTSSHYDDADSTASSGDGEEDDSSGTLSADSCGRTAGQLPSLRRAASYPLLGRQNGGCEGRLPATAGPVKRSGSGTARLSGLIVEVDYGPTPPARLERRYSDRSGLQRRQQRRAGGQIERKKQSVADTADAGRAAGAVPRRRDHLKPGQSGHGRSQSSTVPASVVAEVSASKLQVQHPSPVGSIASPLYRRPSVQFASTAADPSTSADPSTVDDPPLSFVESGGGRSLVVGLDGYFPRPRRNQSLTDFLASHEFRRNVAELDRENAHFRISESLIAAFEMVATNPVVAGVNVDSSAQGSDDKTNYRRRHRHKTRRGRPMRPHDPLRLVDAGETPVSSSASLGSSDAELPVLSGSDVDEITTVAGGGAPSDPVCIPGRPAPSSSAQPVPPTPPPTLASLPGVAGAEITALSLLQRFGDCPLPKAAELVWLVGPDKVPQSLLPMPPSSSWYRRGGGGGCCASDHSDDDDDDCCFRQTDGASSSTSYRSIALRGTYEWAPPRAQIIFSIPKHDKLSVMMNGQSHRCAGCGLLVGPLLAKKYRFCEYMGRLHCSGCHQNQQFYIPARIIHKYDFTRYPVSTFSFQLLHSIWPDPLFHLNTINPAILNQPELQECRMLRKRLSIVHSYITSCRFTGSVLRKHPLPDSYIVDEVDLYSLQNLIEARQGLMAKELRRKYAAYEQHCLTCQLCRGRAHFCQECRHHEPIFPFQLPRVRQCPVCGACYHYLCYPAAEMDGCLRCRRLAQRQNEPATNLAGQDE